MDKREMSPMTLSGQTTFLKYSAVEKSILVQKIDTEGLPEALDIGALESVKTAEESGLIEESVRSLQLLRLVMKAGPGLPFRLNQFHVFEPEVWDEIEVFRGRNGCCILGHCYLKRPTQCWEFAFDLTHEICHAGGFWRFLIRHRPENHEIFCLRQGLGRRRTENRPFEYLGLLEAATESSAENLRAIMEKVTKILTPDDIIRIRNTGTYRRTIAVIRAVIALVTDSRHDPKTDHNSLLTDLITDHLTGRNRFLRAVRRWNPEAVEILRRMDDTEAGAEEAARQIAALP